MVVIAHGFNWHSGQYGRVAEQFRAAGLVYAMDHRGRGKSYVGNFTDHVDDLATFIRLAKSREPGIPVFVLGHSARGVISTLYALDHPSELAGLISESFTLMGLGTRQHSRTAASSFTRPQDQRTRP